MVTVYYRYIYKRNSAIGFSAVRRKRKPRAILISSPDNETDYAEMIDADDGHTHT